MKALYIWLYGCLVVQTEISTTIGWIVMKFGSEIHVQCCRISRAKEATRSVEISPKEATWLSKKKKQRGDLTYHNVRERPLEKYCNL